MTQEWLLFELLPHVTTAHEMVALGWVCAQWRDMTRKSTYGGNVWPVWKRVCAPLMPSDIVNTSVHIQDDKYRCLPGACRITSHYYAVTLAVRWPRTKANDNRDKYVDWTMQRLRARAKKRLRDSEALHAIREDHVGWCERLAQRPWLHKRLRALGRYETPLTKEERALRERFLKP